jgi:glc operon protein GlcG
MECYKKRDMHQKPSLNWTDASKMVSAAKAEAAKNNWLVSIAVVDEAGYVIHLERMDGAVLPSPDIATRKARSAALSRRPTKALEDMTKERPVMLVFPDRLPIQGGLPITHGDQCVGGIGVSGVMSHQDEQIAAAGIAAL